ncbi:MAG TPA: hypothetical protein VFR18_11625 [Terriglobia bacterium]|nr:hypothetical protein [Terriglobia bacterium]
MSTRWFVAAVALVIAASMPFAAQAPRAEAPAAAARWVMPRTPDGHPDLQGVWSYATITPVERSAEFAGKEFLTEQEADAYEKRRRQEMNQDRRDGGAAADLSRAYNDFWWDRGTKVVSTRRTSLVIDPPDGRIPALTPEAQQRNAERAAARRVRGPSDGPEDRPLGDRCILFGSGGVPMLPTAYNNNVQVVQSRDHVVFLNEMIHDARMVPLGARTPLPSNIRQWTGDSHGRWEGDTLVVETTNFTDKTNFRGSSENLQLTERFTRVAEDTLLYRFTVNDPSSFTKPWTVEIPMWRNRELVYEYACHEGNSAMIGILSGARAEEREAEAARARQK